MDQTLGEYAAPTHGACPFGRAPRFRPPPAAAHLNRFGLTIRRCQYTTLTHAHPRQIIPRGRPTPIHRAVRVAGDGWPPQLIRWREGYLPCCPVTDLVARVSVLLLRALVAEVCGRSLSMGILLCSDGSRCRCGVVTNRLFMATVQLSSEQVALSPNHALENGRSRSSLRPSLAPSKADVWRHE